MAAKKQITIDDIAREAGVSTATVSYIVNDRQDVKISEETRRKVLQICNLRQYTPSPVARLLAGKRSDLVGICAPHGGASGARYYALLQALQAVLCRRGYGCVLLSCDGAREVRMQENPEGIFCIDLTEEEFYALKENCFVPIVAVDMMADDPLFFLINSYTTGLQPCVINNILKLTLGGYGGEVSSYEVGLPTEEGIPLPCGASGMYVRAAR